MMRTGIGFDIHRFEKGRRLVLGGVRLKAAAGLAGHSDADVVCHAVMDALLGAIAAGDLGVHFPDREKRWQGADSLKMLAAVARQLASRGAQVVNVDVSVLAEKPRLAPHREKMRRNLAKAMGVTMADVSVKATTLEGLGALGRGEGIAAMAVAAVKAE